MVPATSGVLSGSIGAAGRATPNFIEEKSWKKSEDRALITQLEAGGPVLAILHCECTNISIMRVVTVVL